MDAAATIKRVPKWAWIASGGIVAGVLVMRARGLPGQRVDTTASEDYTSAGEYVQTASSFPAQGVVGAGAFYPSEVSSNSQDVAGLIEALTPLFPVDNSQYAIDAIRDSQRDAQQSIADAIANLNVGGGAQTSTATATQPAAPSSAATPPATKPVVVSPCGGDYPFENSGDCYKVVCASGKGDYAAGRWHFYKSGRKVRVSSQC